MVSVMVMSTSAGAPYKKGLLEETFFIELMTDFHRKMNQIVNIPVKERTKATFHLHER